MKVNQLTAAQMAEEMGVQRSNVSHVLSGRNKPSFEFLSKLLLRYPKVNAHWLITGKSQSPEDVEEEKQQPSTEGKKEPVVKPLTEVEQEIERVMIFYRNGTFKTFTPGEKNHD